MAVAFEFLSEKAFEDPNTWQLRTCSYQSKDETWKALREFCDLTYWTRKWIIQEIVVAKKSRAPVSQCQDQLSTAEEVFKKFGAIPRYSPSDKGEYRPAVKHWAAIKDSRPALLCQERLSSHRNEQPSYSLSQLM